MFLNKIIDWKEFEKFVAELYKDDGDVTVEHNVTLKGKSGADRQIDVLITRRTKLHSYQTMVECKYWKNRVERSVVDIVYAGMDDLNISKGVIFTTTGYEAGAVEYAKAKNIDIFLVRDLTPEEWGLPGQVIEFYLHLVTGTIESMTFPSAIGIPVVENYPTNYNLTIELSKDTTFSEDYQLFSVKDGKKGENLLQYILLARSKLLSYLTKDYFKLNDGNDCTIVITAPVILDFSKFEYRQLRNQYGAINLSKISFNIKVYLSQSSIKIDRAEKYNIALCIQNYMENQVNLVYQEKGQEGLILTDNIYDKIVNIVTSNDNETLKNGSIIKVMSEYWVKPNVEENKTVIDKYIETPIVMELQSIAKELLHDGEPSKNE